MEFGLAEVGVLSAQLPDLLAQERWRGRSSAPVRSTGFRRERGGVAGVVFEGLTPAIERTNADLKGLAGSDFAVPIGKFPDRKAVLGMFGSHPPNMP